MRPPAPDEAATQDERVERTLLRHIVDMVPAMIAYWGSDQRNRFANRAYEDWFGVRPEALLGRTMRDLLGPVIYTLNHPYILGALRGEAQEFERDLPSPRGGPVRRAQAHYLPHVEGGAVLGFVVLVFDVTERRREVASRLEAEGRLRAISESLREALVSMDTEGRVISWNRGAEETFGYTAAEMIGQAITALLPARPEAREGWAQGLGIDPARGLAGPTEVVGRRRGGDEFPLEASLSTWSTPEGRFFTGVLRDVSARRREERALRASEERFRALSRHAPVGIFETDATGGLRFANDYWEALSGMTAAQSAGDGWVESIHPDDRAQVLREWTASCAEEREFRVEHRLRGAEREVWVVCSAVALRGESGEVTGYLGTVVDITASKRAERALRESLQEKEALLREIHHRVKNNLQVISSLLRLQARGIDDPEALAAFTESEGRVRSIALLHESLYRASDLARVGMDDYLRGLTADLLRTYGAPPDVRVVIDARGVSLDVDAAVPSGLIVNELVTNSLKHAFPEGRGRVEVRMRRAGDHVELLVSDDGVGLGPERDPDDRATLGLRLVRTLARQLRATLSIERAPGTRALITFDAAAVGDVATEAAP